MPIMSDSNRLRFSKCFALDAVMFLDTDTEENRDNRDSIQSKNQPNRPPREGLDFASSFFLRGPPDSAIPLA